MSAWKRWGPKPKLLGVAVVNRAEHNPVDADFDDPAGWAVAVRAGPRAAGDEHEDECQDTFRQGGFLPEAPRNSR